MDLQSHNADNVICSGHVGKYFIAFSTESVDLTTDTFYNPNLMDNKTFKIEP